MRATNLSLPAVEPSVLLLGRKIRWLFLRAEYRRTYNYESRSEVKHFVGYRVRPLWPCLLIALTMFGILVYLTEGLIQQHREDAKQLAHYAKTHHFKNGQTVVCNEDKNDSNSTDPYWTPCKVITQIDNNNYSVSYKGWDNNNWYTNTTRVDSIKFK